MELGKFTRSAVKEAYGGEFPVTAGFLNSAGRAGRAALEPFVQVITVVLEFRSN